MEVLAFAATNNLDSINKKLLVCAADYMKGLDSDCQVEFIDLNDYEMPIYRPDRETRDGIPRVAQSFFKRISESDKLMISFAEYNGSYTAAYKNIFDWTSRIDQKLYQNKPTLIMATSPGKRGGAGVLRTVREAAPHFGMDLRGEFSLPLFKESFNSELGKIQATDKEQELYELLRGF